MIKLTINQDQIDNLFSEINLKVLGIKSLTDSSVAEEIAKAAFTLTGQRFVRAVDVYSISNPKKMHHVYEWQRIGKPSARLFVLERASTLDGILDINVKFLQSRIPVPVPQELLTPGTSGKSVTSRSIFKDKASTMESGKPVTFTARKIITFLGNNGQVFLQPGTRVNILNPGGVQVKNSFQNFMTTWYQANTESIMYSSGFYERMVNEVALALNSQKAGVDQVRAAVAEVARIYSEDKVVVS